MWTSACACSDMQGECHPWESMPNGPSLIMEHEFSQCVMPQPFSQLLCPFPLGNTVWHCSGFGTSLHVAVDTDQYLGVVAFSLLWWLQLHQEWVCFSLVFLPPGSLGCSQLLLHSNNLFCFLWICDWIICRTMTLKDVIIFIHCCLSCHLLP